MRYALGDSVRLIPGVGPKIHEELLRMGVTTYADLLRWFPRRYIDGSQTVPVRQVRYGEQVAVRVRMGRLEQKYTKTRGIRMLESLCSDDSGELTVRWFNQPYLQNKLEEGSEWILIGVVRPFNGKRVLVNPRVEHEPRIIPLYPQTKSVSSTQLTGFIRWVLAHAELGDGVLPTEVASEHGLLGFAEALRCMHQPASQLEISQARQYFAFEEVFDFFTTIEQGRQNVVQEQGIVIRPDMEWFRGLVQALPFTLTDGQRQVAWEILQDLAAGALMTRLLNGDVGSGKTVVAALAAAAVAREGYRTIILVPTEILARQHAQSLERLLGSQNISVAVWTAARKDTLEADIIVGTHALLQEHIAVEKVALVVIDEQHRFGVRQRNLLRERHAQLPHLLSMTATPIPRTLALALFADLSVSFLRDKPADRLPVITQIIPKTSMGEVHQRVLTELAAGHQVLVLCPLIQETSGDGEDELSLFDQATLGASERKTVLAEAERLRTEHPEYGVVEVVHGKMKASEKQSVMERMAAGEIQVLVATSVIEVGVDLPNATVMIIENAEQFGLAQLHQFRGRVGRGASQSFCFLCPGVWNETIQQRLAILAESTSGFDVAERDLALRGPGDLAGLVQSGLPDFRLATLADVSFLQHIREICLQYCQKYPDFVTSYSGIRSSNQLTSLE